jgi:hypothetical protein
MKIINDIDVFLKTNDVKKAGHYFVETLQQKKILDEIVINEGLFDCKCLNDCDAFCDGECPLSNKCGEFEAI